MMPLLTELEPFGFAGFYKDVSPDGLLISERGCGCKPSHSTPDSQRFCESS